MRRSLSRNRANHEPFFVVCALVAIMAGGLMTAPASSQPSEPAGSAAEGQPAGTVTYVGNRAWRHPGGGDERLALKRRSTVFAEDVVVAEGGPVEIELPDGSAVRIAAGSRLALDESSFPEDESQGRSFSVRLLMGRTWANVTGEARGEDKFEIRTQSAAAGVRGTSFRVDARADRSTLVRVYQGAVAVRGLPQVEQDEPAPEERRQVEGPAEITRKEWERRVEAMMGVEVSATGRVGEAAPFDPDADREDPWVEWNMERDAGR